MKDGFVKIAAGIPALRVADTEYNVTSAAAVAAKAGREGAHVLVLPELCLTGYTCGDLFLQELLLEGAEAALLELCESTRSLNMLIFVGLPIRHGGKLYSCAAAIFGGRVLGIVPKSHIPNYGESYELRYFAPAPSELGTVKLGGVDVPFGCSLLFRCEAMPELCVACEICEDLLAASSPSVAHCAAGANVIVNPAASSEAVGKQEFRRKAAELQSAKLICAYAYANAGMGESTTDVVFSGHSLICENGSCVAEALPFCDRELIVQAVDLRHICYDRQRINTVNAEAVNGYKSIYFPLRYETVELSGRLPSELSDRAMSPFGGYVPSRYPFIPSDDNERRAHCRLVLDIQTRGLCTRFNASGSRGLVIGISGGLDSCLALLIAVRAVDYLGLGRDCIEAITMPCFGTTSRTRGNAEELCRLLGVKLRCIDIANTVSSHFNDIGHSPDKCDVVFENAQARERTQILFDVANGCGALVVGTGDLSELALGFATYNGDHMSSYGVNSDIPKTLVRCLVRYLAEGFAADGETELSKVLYDIVNTPVSPELLPADENGEIGQKTEELVGPYELHDFYLYRMLRYGERPSKLFRMAKLAFAGEFTPDEIKRWMNVFLRRFFSQQFKRSCLPDGPKVGSVALSPRGDLRMPSDAAAELWLKEASEL